MEVVIIFTSKLKKTRKSKCLIQEDIAGLLGISKTTYSRKENNLIPFTREELSGMKEFLELTDKEFVDIFFK